MPIDIQCPDCEHVFGVPSSMAGKRTLCRGCNAALIVPDAGAEEIPLEKASARPSGRIAPVDEKPPNWDTPIPFRSPGPIVGVLLIAWLASTLVLIGYGLARTPTAATTKPAPYTPTPKAPEPIDPEPKAVNPGQTPGYEREIILPNREVILPRYGKESQIAENSHLPPNWYIVKESTSSGAAFHLHDSGRGHIAASIPESGSRAVGVQITASPSGLWLAQVADSTLRLHSSRNPDDPILKWEPYSGAGRTRNLARCAILSDERLLTVSDDGSFDLWAIPGGDYIRRVVALPANRDRAAVGSDVCHERSLLAVRDGSKLGVYSLEDDASGTLAEFATAGLSDSRIRFTPDGKRIAAISRVVSTPAMIDDRVEIFDIAAAKRTASWTIPSGRRDIDEWAWSVGSEEMLVHRRDLGAVSAYRLSDGKLQSAIELGEARNNALLDGPAQRLHILASPPLPARLYGFDLPLRTPANLQKNPVWEYKAGVLELKKAAR